MGGKIKNVDQLKIDQKNIRRKMLIFSGVSLIIFIVIWSIGSFGGGQLFGRITHETEENTVLSGSFDPSRETSQSSRKLSGRVSNSVKRDKDQILDSIRKVLEENERKRILERTSYKKSVTVSDSNVESGNFQKEISTVQLLIQEPDNQEKINSEEEIRNALWGSNIFSESERLSHLKDFKTHYLNWEYEFKLLSDDCSRSISDGEIVHGIWATLTDKVWKREREDEVRFTIGGVLLLDDPHLPADRTGHERYGHLFRENEEE